MNQKRSSNNTYILGGNRLTLPKCMLCDHFIDDGNDKVMRCVAFPEGIPNTVLWDDIDKECNAGIKFEDGK
jgi:hypothetical protein